MTMMLPPITTKTAITILLFGAVTVAAILFILTVIKDVYGSTQGAIMDGEPRITLFEEEDHSFSLFVRVNDTTTKLSLDTLPMLNMQIQKLTLDLERLIDTIQKLKVS